MTQADEAALYEQEWRRLRNAVDSIPDELRTAPIDGTWTIKEVIAHVAAWDRELLAGVDEVLAGQPPHYEGTVEDEFNADVAASVAGTSLEDVLTEAEAAHWAVMEKLASIPPERWEVELPIRWRNGRPVTFAGSGLFGYRYNGHTHFGGHAMEIEEWLASQTR
jgi:hypothetical protein